MQFGSHRALDALDVTVERGVTGLVGANGAGKNTLMSILLRLRAPTSGTATVLGLDPTTDGAHLRAVVGYGPERNQFPEDMPASDFVKHLAEVRGMPKQEARSRASDALWLVGLGEERFRALGTMSTGQRQRVKLAQALAADPSLVFLDEPTDGLDPVQRDEMLLLIRQINDDYGIDVVLSSHLLEEVERICDHVVALDAGRLVAQGSLADLVGTLRRDFPSSGEINFTVADSAKVMERVEANLAPLARSEDRTDGLSLAFHDWRLNLRASNTEPLLRLDIETRGSATVLAARVAEVSALIGGTRVH